jgi:hypothetical protein
MNEFKLQFYFNLYKNKALPNRDEFRKNFKKNYGEFQYTEELIKMIEKYQMRKYGETLHDGKSIEHRTSEERSKINKKVNQQMRYEFKRR